MEYLLKEKEILDYMGKNIRKLCQPTRAIVHSVEFKEKDNPCISVLQRLQIQQAEYQANMENILQRMTQVVTENPKVTQSGIPVGNNNYCWYHNSDKHSINRCSTFHNLELTVKVDVTKKILICFQFM